ncbi:MAG: hypothetical protein Q9175_008136, partial [Cornicularia normoerica]
MVCHWDNDSKDAGGVAVYADEYFHVAAVLSGWECGDDGGADGGFEILGPVEGDDPGYQDGGLGWHGGRDG